MIKNETTKHVTEYKTVSPSLFVQITMRRPSMSQSILEYFNLSQDLELGLNWAVCFLKVCILTLLLYLRC